MTTTGATDNYTEAVEAFGSYNESLTNLFALMDADTSDDWEELSDGVRQAATDADIADWEWNHGSTSDVQEKVYGAISNFGLSLELSTTTRDQVRYIFCTGGPHFEITWQHGFRNTLQFVSMPWFDRIEMNAAYADGFARLMDHVTDIVDMMVEADGEDTWGHLCFECDEDIDDGCTCDHNEDEED